MSARHGEVIPSSKGDTTTMNGDTSVTQAAIVVGGIDAHADTHHVVALDATGKVLGDHQFPASSLGYRDALDWPAGFGVIDKIGVESTGSYAAGITRFLLDAGIDVAEANQPHPHLRARRGKDDKIDAEAAARKALSGQATAVPKTTPRESSSRSVCCVWPVIPRSAPGQGRSSNCAAYSSQLRLSYENNSPNDPRPCLSRDAPT